jgi:hypothetical protein
VRKDSSRKEGDQVITKESGVKASADATVDRGRRKAMCKIAVGVGALAGYSMLPEQWTKPIIDQIVLPAHAGTSGSALHDPCTVEKVEGDRNSETVSIRVTGFVTPPTANLPVLIIAVAAGGTNSRVEAQTVTGPEGTFEALMTIGGGPGISSVAVTTNVTGADGAAHCSVDIGTDEVTGNFSGDLSITISAWSADHPEHVATTSEVPFCVSLDSSTVRFYDEENSTWQTFPLDNDDGFLVAWDNYKGDGFFKFTILEKNSDRIRVRFEHYNHEDYSNEEIGFDESWWEGGGEGWLEFTETSCGQMK